MRVVERVERHLSTDVLNLGLYVSLLEIPVGYTFLHHRLVWSTFSK